MDSKNTPSPFGSGSGGGTEAETSKNANVFSHLEDEFAGLGEEFDQFAQSLDYLELPAFKTAVSRMLAPPAQQQQQYNNRLERYLQKEVSSTIGAWGTTLLDEVTQQIPKLMIEDIERQAIAIALDVSPKPLNFKPLTHSLGSSLPKIAPPTSHLDLQKAAIANAEVSVSDVHGVGTSFDPELIGPSPAGVSQPATDESYEKSTSEELSAEDIEYMIRSISGTLPQQAGAEILATAAVFTVLWALGPGDCHHLDYLIYAIVLAKALMEYTTVVKGSHQ